MTTASIALTCPSRFAPREMSYTWHYFLDGPFSVWNTATSDHTSSGSKLGHDGHRVLRTELQIKARTRRPRWPSDLQHCTNQSLVMVGILVSTLLSIASFHSCVSAVKTCKATPYSKTWPSEHDWQALNSSIDGRLLKTVPAASSCWSGNPYGSEVSCDSVDVNWTSGIFHAARPESIDYPIWANNSCLPPGAPGYDKQQGCELGGLPEFIVNATKECHVATALKWADERNIRVSVKGTGHDMNGRYVIRAQFCFTGTIF